jgi:hypothetical protein
LPAHGETIALQQCGLMHKAVGFVCDPVNAALRD